MERAPIALFAYKRPKHTRRLLESLAQNEGAEQSQLFIFCDAAKREQDQIGVAQVREIVRSKQWCQTVQIVERQENIGLARSIVSGMTELCDTYGRAIVIEDDLVLSPHFLNYMNDALERYEMEPKVMHVGGYLYPLTLQLSSACFLRLANVWGWGTWQRAWQHYDSNGEAWLERFRSNSLEQEFSLYGSRPYMEFLEKQVRGEIDSWAIYWSATVFYKQGLGLYPPKSLVENTGFDGSGTHCTTTSVLGVSPDEIFEQSRVTLFPDLIEENKAVTHALVEYFKAIRPRKGTLWERGTYKLRKGIRKTFERFGSSANK